MWTKFYDMHSGGGSKEKWEQIYIEASEKGAIIIFYNRFGHNPNRVTCTCCGKDYSISEDESIESLTEFYRNKARYTETKDLMPIDEYEALPNVLFIRANEIKDADRQGHVPVQGYVWVGE